MLTAVISVLIGSIAGCLATLQVERVRARRNEAEMAEERRRAEKRAFRLVERELDIAAQQIADAAAAGHYLRGDWQSLTLEWGEQRPVLPAVRPVAPNSPSSCRRSRRARFASPGRIARLCPSSSSITRRGMMRRTWSAARRSGQSTCHGGMYSSSALVSRTTV